MPHALSNTCHMHSAIHLLARHPTTTRLTSTKPVLTLFQVLQDSEDLHTCEGGGAYKVQTTNRSGITKTSLGSNNYQLAIRRPYQTPKVAVRLYVELSHKLVFCAQLPSLGTIAARCDYKMKESSLSSCSLPIHMRASFAAANANKGTKTQPREVNKRNKPTDTKAKAQ